MFAVGSRRTLDGSHDLRAEKMGGASSLRRAPITVTRRLQREKDASAEARAWFLSDFHCHGSRARCQQEWQMGWKLRSVTNPRYFIGREKRSHLELLPRFPQTSLPSVQSFSSPTRNGRKDREPCRRTGRPITAISAGAVPRIDLRCMALVAGGKEKWAKQPGTRSLVFPMPVNAAERPVFPTSSLLCRVCPVSLPRKLPAHPSSLCRPETFRSVAHPSTWKQENLLRRRSAILIRHPDHTGPLPPSSPLPQQG